MISMDVVVVVGWLQHLLIRGRANKLLILIRHARGAYVLDYLVHVWALLLLLLQVVVGANHITVTVISSPGAPWRHCMLVLGLVTDEFKLLTQQ